MKQNKLLASIFRLIKEGLYYENGVTAQSKLVKEFCEREDFNQCCSHSF